MISQAIFAERSASEFVDPSSRYLNSDVILYGKEKKITFGTYVRKPIQTTGNEYILIITKGFEYRPDLVAHKVYGRSELWWLIMEHNRIHDIFDFKSGRTIQIPNQTTQE